MYGLLKNGTFIIKNKILVHSASLPDIALTKMGDFQIPVMGKWQPKFFSKSYLQDVLYKRDGQFVSPETDFASRTLTLVKQNKITTGLLL